MNASMLKLMLTLPVSTLLRVAVAEPVFREDFVPGVCSGSLDRLMIESQGAVLKIGNLISNGSFEVSSTRTHGFYIYGGGGVVDTNTAMEGAHAVRLDKSDSLYLHPSNTVAVREGEAWYTVSAWVKVEPGSAGDHLRAQLRVWGQGTNRQHTQVIAAQVLGRQDWLRLVQPVRLDESTRYLACDVGFNAPGRDAAGSRVWIDGVQIEAGRRPTRFTEYYYRLGHYTSPRIVLAARSGRIGRRGECPPGTAIETRWRAARRPEKLADAAWSDWTAANPLPFRAWRKPYFQFQVRLLAKDRGLATPRLDSVDVE